MPDHAGLATARLQRSKLNLSARAWIVTALCILSAMGQGAVAIKGLPDVGQAASPGEAPATNAAGVGTSQVEGRLAVARGELAAATVIANSSPTNLPAGFESQDVWSRRTLLQRLVGLYEQQLGTAAELQSTKSNRVAVLKVAQDWTGFAEPRPYSIHLADRLREELQAERLKIASAESAMGILEQLVEENRKSFRLAEENLRQLDEGLEKISDAQSTARLTRQRDLERLRAQVAGAAVSVLDLERSLRQEILAVARIRVGVLSRQLVVADAGAVFSLTDLDEAIGKLDRERAVIEDELNSAQTRREDALKAWQAVRENSGPVKIPSAVQAISATDGAEELALRQAELETADAKLRVLRLILESVNCERNIWEKRFSVSESRSSEKIADSERSMTAFNHRLRLWREHENQQLEVAASQVQLQEARMNSLPLASPQRKLSEARMLTMRERDEILLRGLRHLQRLARLTERWGESLKLAEEQLPLTGRIKNLFSDGQLFLQRLWTFELFSAVDTITVDGQQITGRRSITVGKVIMAALILTLGYWVTGVATRACEPIFIRRFKIEPNQAGLIRRWLRTFLIVALVIFSLVSVRIPLTVFAFAGGALAIGLGFGMQTLLKNFVSGLIILFEQPFRVGDVLDVGGQRGVITGVGLRASVLQLWDGTETLIPNSNLLENNLTNWTYTNRKVRFTVAVGVAYASDPRRVTQILQEVTERHGLVEKDPKPQVLFTEFGESTLMFELRFWIDVTKANSALVASDLRMMLVTSLAEQGISIAFPQRDLHLHAAVPIPVDIQPRPASQFPVTR
jgi:potassium efflux system protein